MSKINKRLENLEAALKPVKGCVVLYADLDQEDIYWDQPNSAKDQCKYTEDDRRELDVGHDDLIVVRYVKNWRSGEAQE
jgi:hypothetical protein